MNGMMGNMGPSGTEKATAKSFEELISDVEINTERRAFLTTYDGKRFHDAESIEVTVKLLNTVSRSARKYISIEIEIAGERKTVDTDKEKEYFEDLIGKKVYISGIKTTRKNRSEKWYIMSCYDLTDRVQSILESELLSEEEKRRFQVSVKDFPPEIQRDLANRTIQVAQMKLKEKPDKTERTLYKEVYEMEALYNTIRPMIPPEFREIFELSRLCLEKRESRSEKKNYIKVMQAILDFDWSNNYKYKEIDIDRVSEELAKKHVGHEKQLDVLITEFKASNISGKPPKTLSLIGRSGVGCTSLAVSIAEALGKKYSIIDLSGVRMKESDSLLGSSKIYDNARIGLLFEKIKEAGIFGVIILEKFDLYDSDVYSILAPLVERSIFQDNFTEIKIDLSNMFVIITSNSVQNIPPSLRAHTNEIYFPDLTEKEMGEVINKVMLPKYCKEFGLELEHEIPEDICHKLIYRYANRNMHKLDGVIRTLVVKTVTGGADCFPNYSEKKMNELDFDESEYERIKNEYINEITAVENKLWTCFDEYPKSLTKRAIELVDILCFSTEESEKAYARKALHYIVNIFAEQIKPYEPGAVIRELTKTHYLQHDFAARVESYILSCTLKRNSSGMVVIGLEGAAGTGKTTMAKSIAAAMGRKCIKVNVGSADSSIVIKGANKIANNAEPGQIIREMARSGNGSYSSVIILDEVDKAGTGFYSSLYEFLDTNEDYYYDEYLECKIPKNNFVVVLTFNEIQKIPIPIRDRMQVIKYDNYSLRDKKHIISGYILERLKDKFGMDSITLEEEALELYVNCYDIEPGMRDAERDLEYVLMRIAGDKHGRLDKNTVIKTEDIRAFLSEPKAELIYGIQKAAMGKVGVVQALAVCGEYGTCFSIETVVNPYQKKDIVITGLPQGSCMESIEVARSVVERCMNQELPKLHLHMTDAMKKDGPSAGLAICMSILSCIMKKRLPNCAFTGSIDLHCNVGAVGGVFEKLTAAERMGIKKVFIPEENFRILKSKGQLDRLSIEVIPIRRLEDAVSKVWRIKWRRDV